MASEESGSAKLDRTGANMLRLMRDFILKEIERSENCCWE